MAGLCEGGNEPSGSLKAISNGLSDTFQAAVASIFKRASKFSPISATAAPLKRLMARKSHVVCSKVTLVCTMTHGSPSRRMIYTDYGNSGFDHSYPNAFTLILRPTVHITVESRPPSHSIECAPCIMAVDFMSTYMLNMESGNKGKDTRGEGFDPVLWIELRRSSVATAIGSLHNVLIYFMRPERAKQGLNHVADDDDDDDEENIQKIINAMLPGVTRHSK
ncbi:hypothetical protein ANN_18817 [Periplaneta americana]|uniref:Uncharacterized protein n=1 Tax=Periplaneta americana TaxID=6978 RepID=A0ABQ8SR76_PERAM|nr:hypothetical protein ANN_18817 [Periplaneta americana]